MNRATLSHIYDKVSCQVVPGLYPVYRERSLGLRVAKTRSLPAIRHVERYRGSSQLKISVTSISVALCPLTARCCETVLDRKGCYK